MKKNPVVHVLAPVGYALGLVASWGSPSPFAPAAVAALSLAIPAAVYAQPGAASASARDFDIAAGPLAEALRRFAVQAALELRVPPELTAGKASPALKGRFTVDEALQKLLAQSGLIFLHQGAQAIAIAAAPTGVNVLGAVRVAGAAAGGASGGVSAAGWGAGPNGSSDASATEGSGTYAATTISMGDGSMKSLKEVPQSVSVIGRKQIDEQNLVTLTDVLQQTPGVTVLNDLNGEYAFYARGFQIERVQVDGGAPTRLGGGNFTGLSVRGNLAAVYDHVEVMRGGVSATDGFSAPSGSVNLQRKRPLDHRQWIAEASYGSWNERRVMVDATAPIGFDGRLRARSVLAAGAQDYFYATADSRNTTVYTILEADVSPTTMLSFGGSRKSERGTLDSLGLPRNSDGSLADYPRRTSFVPSWSRLDLRTHELFAKIEHHFDSRWSWNVDLTRIGERAGALVALLDTRSGITPEGFGLGASPGSVTSSTRHWMVSSVLRGKFQLYGLEQQVAFGLSRTKIKTPDYRRAFLFDSQYFNISRFDPDTTLPTPDPSLGSIGADTVRGEVDQTAFVRLNASLTSRLRATVGFAWLQNKYSEVTTDRFSLPGFVDEQLTSTGVNNTHFAPTIVGLSFDLNPRYTVYGSVADAFEANGNSRIYIGPRTDPLQVPTADQTILAEPTTGKNFETGVKYASEDQRLSASAALFYLRQRKVLLPDTFFESTQGVTGCCILQGGERVSKGLELTVSGEIARGAQITAGYTYNRFELNTSIADIPSFSSTPTHLFNLWGSYRPNSEMLNKLTLHAGVNFESSIRNTATLYPAVYDESGRPVEELAPIDFAIERASYAVYGAGLDYRFSKNWTAQAKVDNVFDKKYYRQIGSTSANFYGAPRSVAVTVRGSF